MSGVEGALAGGVVSLSVGLLTTKYNEYLINKRLDERKNEEWAKRAISNVKRIRREAMKLDVTMPIEISGSNSYVSEERQGKIDAIEDLVTELDKKRENIPADYRGSMIESTISDLIIFFESPEDLSDDYITIELRSKLIEKSERILDEFEQVMDSKKPLY